jgi:hypothetical protein
MTLADVTSAYQNRYRSVNMASIASTSFMCLDDRVTEPSLGTPGGELGEFVLALSAYLQERDGAAAVPPRQEVVDAFLLKYLKTLPASRPMIHCTDDRAVRHLEEELSVENLDLQEPAKRAVQAGLLERLTEVENQGDSHIRLLLKQPQQFHVDARLPPMVLKAFYKHLWQQNQEPGSFLHQSPKLRLLVLVGETNPEAFYEVVSGESCQRDGEAPLLVPREAGHAVLVSHLDAVGSRREELASFFARISNATPRKVDKQRMRQVLDHQGWLALETTGRRVASGLPFFTLKYGE